MYNKTLSLIFVLFLLSMSVVLADADNLTIQMNQSLSFDADCTDDLGLKDCTLGENYAFVSEGIESGAVNMTEGYIDTNLNGAHGDKSFSFWINFQEADSGTTYQLFGSTIPANSRFYLHKSNVPTLKFFIGTSSCEFNLNPVQYSWYHIGVTHNNANGTTRLFLNGTVVDDCVYSATDDNTVDYYIGTLSSEGTPVADRAKAIFDEYYIWIGRVLDDVEMLALADRTSSTSFYPFGAATPPTPTAFKVDVLDENTRAGINNFTVTLSNSTDTYINVTQTGNITFANITNGTYDIKISSLQAGGYHNTTFESYDTSVNLTVNLTKLFNVDNITYFNFIEFNSTNFTRNLTFEINLNCPSFANTSSTIFINNTAVLQTDLTCTNVSQIVTGNYIHSKESIFNITHLFNNTYLEKGNIEIFGYGNFTSDLTNPTIETLNFTIPEGFAVPLTNITLKCSDTVFISNITYNSTFNDVNFIFGNFSNGTAIINETDLLDGSNLIKGSCADPFGKTSLELNITVFNGELILIDEIDNVDFNLDNVTGARAYFDENQTFFDFKVVGTNRANFSASVTNRIRIELIYLDGTIITRYIDMSLLGQEIRVCANKEGTTHYQQLIVSARERSTILQNVFADCVVAADSTRFAFQDAFVLQAFTISSLYSLISVRAGREVILASLDGSLESFINLDSLELAETPFNLNIQPETISFEKTGTTIMQIRYLNLRSDNTALTIDITNMDTDTSVFSSSDFANLDDVTLFFDYSTLFNVTNSTLFVIQVDSTKETTTNSFKRYFNINASTGIITTQLAFVISFLLVVFGLTFTATRLTLGWFGIFMLIFAIATLSFSVLTTVTLFLMAVETLLLVFIFIVLAINSYSTLT